MDTLQEANIVSIYVVYQILKKLTTPFNKTDAYRLKIIDAQGNILRKRHTLRTTDEQNASTMLDTLVWKLKRLLEKLPFGKTKLASYAAALWLIKEQDNYQFYMMDENAPVLYETFGDYYLEMDLNDKEKEFVYKALNIIESIEESFIFTPTLQVLPDELNLKFAEICDKLKENGE
jgi:hypothetical protein